jgi:hypothetical protein
MWLCVDRIEGDTVVLTDEDERLYRMARADYTALTGREPAESDMLSAEVEGDRILSAAYDEAETAARRESARKRLNRLFGRA